MIPRIPKLPYISTYLIEYSFNGSTPPSPGANTGKYGLCHTSGGSYTAGKIYYDTGVALLDITPTKGVQAISTAAISGTVSMLSNSVYIAQSDSAPYSWTIKGESSGSNDVIQMLNTGVASNRSTSSGSYSGVGGTPGDLVGSFNVTTAGKYQVILRVTNIGSGNWAYFRLKFDYTGTPIYVGTDDTSWIFAHYGSPFTYAFIGAVTLTAGSHNVAVEWKVVGGTVNIYTSYPNALVIGCM